MLSMTAAMPSRLEALHQEAKDLFLGRDAVVGIGIADETGAGLMQFLLSEDRPQTRSRVRQWAARNNVGVAFLTTGPITMEH